MLAVSSYKGVNGLSFGSDERAIRSVFGEPESRRANRDGVIELRYAGFIARLDLESKGLSEITLLPECEGSLNGTPFTWKPGLLATIQEMDPDLVEVLGFVVSLRLGIALSGFHDGDQSQMAIHAFQEGDWDCFRNKMKPLRIT